ncbi:MAG TPA: TerC family protein [Pirellulales bacterium]|nr:TerC family protein [Pirellulales bacterium]
MIPSFAPIGTAIGLLAQCPGPVAADAPTLWHWLAFGAFVVVLLTVDLFIFHRDSHEPTLRESAMWTVIWCAVALAFNGLTWWWRGPDLGIKFLTGYLVEWSLSMDNVFVFAVIFSFFAVPLKYQYRVLFWGIIGAIAMRLTFILAGTALLHKFDFIIWIFGGFLIYTGFKLWWHSDSKVDPQNNLLMRLAKRVFTVSSEEHGERFFAVENGRRAVTPLFLVLLVIESTDVLFAVDSVPAILGVTTDSFTVFTSNIFAILGLRALYFLLAGVMGIFRYLNYGLAAVLIFIGGKMVAQYWLVDYGAPPAPDCAGGAAGHHDLISPQVSLVVIISLLALSIVASLVARRVDPDKPGASPDGGP